MSPTRRGSIGAGFSALSHGKLILLLALTTAVLGVSAAMPLAPTLSDAVAGTLAGDHFIRNHPTFAPTDLFDLLHEKAAAFAGTERAAGWAGLLAVLAQAFFAGGVVAVLGRGPFSFGQFFEPARRNFWHNVKCGVLFAVLAVAVLGLWFGAVGGATHKALERVPPDASVRTFLWWVQLLVGVFLFAGLSLLYDFARASRRYAPRIGAWRGYGFARRALSDARAAALGIFLFWLFLGGIAVLLPLALAWSMPAVSPLAILVLSLLQFGVFYVRSAARVAAWGSYVEFLDARAASSS